MKKHITISFGGVPVDCIIEYFMVTDKDKDGKIIYTKPEDNIAKCTGRVNSVSIYMPEFSKDGDTSYYKLLTINGYAFKSIISAVSEVEQIKTEEFID